MLVTAMGGLAEEKGSDVVRVDHEADARMRCVGDVGVDLHFDGSVLDFGKPERTLTCQGGPLRLGQMEHRNRFADQLTEGCLADTTRPAAVWRNRPYLQLCTTHTSCWSC